VRQDRVDRMQIDFRLAAAGDAEQQIRAKRREIAAYLADRMSLLMAG
jgi:hypothetical protein